MHLRATSLTPPDEALNGTGHVAAAVGLFTTFSPVVAQVISSPPKHRFSHDKLGKVSMEKHTGFPHCVSRKLATF